MKEKIEQIIQSIVKKQNALKDNAREQIEAIPINQTKNEAPQPATHSTPPISYILYGIAALAFIFMICTGGASEAASGGESGNVGLKIFWGVICALCAFGGYYISNKRATSSPSSSTPIISLSEKKSYMIKRISSCTKMTADSWDTFMTGRKNDIQKVLQEGGLSREQLDDVLPKTYMTEIINFSVLDVMSRINNVADNASGINTLIEIKEDCKKKLCAKIDEAANKQIATYKLILRSIQ